MRSLLAVVSALLAQGCGDCGELAHVPDGVYVATSSDGASIGEAQARGDQIVLDYTDRAGTRWHVVLVEERLDSDDSP